ncbi:hypothetical protein SFMTTN_1720 [Sulfuriferula multivorans]|uniref:Uncharacterized protein n=1 Tax=Sulfuriferula multivorans TaxID=1559896 RepID=A0A401JE51_9PROT|nr:hypothetical protein SFMTTN_1720 [Sulfuriferula multivorans]
MQGIQGAEYSRMAEALGDTAGIEKMGLPIKNLQVRKHVYPSQLVWSSWHLS